MSNIFHHDPAPPNHTGWANPPLPLPKPQTYYEDGKPIAGIKPTHNNEWQAFAVAKAGIFGSKEADLGQPVATAEAAQKIAEDWVAEMKEAAAGPKASGTGGGGKPTPPDEPVDSTLHPTLK